MRHGRQGFTLVELMMGLFITSITGLAVAGVSMVVSTAYSNSEDHYDAMESARSAMRRLQFSLQGAALVTAVSPDGTKLAYWTGDENSDGQINLLELRVIERDSDSSELVEHRLEFPDSWAAQKIDDENEDKSLQDAVQMSNIDQWITRSDYCSTSVYATGVDAISLAPSPQVPLATIVNINAAFRTGDYVVTLTGAASLRANMTNYVYLDGDNYKFISAWEESWE